MHRLRLVLGVALVALVVSAPLAGQVGPRGRFSVDLSTPAIRFPVPAVTEFDAGWVDHPGVVVSVQSRPKQESWELRLRAAGPDLGGYGKPVSDILWRVDGSSAWSTLSAADDVVLQGQGDRDITVYFRLRLSWELDIPDGYSTGLVFSALRL